ncbi:MAG: PssD/Cps14F family polysaccharide biosynthesis glycosyltransferase [Nanoarchaeota archaeon]
MKKRHICFASSRGGHLTELQQIIECFSTKKFSYFILSDKSHDTRHMEYDIRYIRPFLGTYPLRAIYPHRLIQNFWQVLRILRKERPDVVISTGASICLPALLTARCMGITTIFVESLNRVHTPSVTGRIAALFVDRVYIQWPELAQAYARAKAEIIYAGDVLS